jgi:hypothetical protein
MAASESHNIDDEGCASPRKGACNPSQLRSALHEAAQGIKTGGKNSTTPKERPTSIENRAYK